MKRTALAHLVTPTRHADFELDEIRGTDQELVEAFLVATDTRTVYPIVAGIAVLWEDLTACVRRHGNVFDRTPAHDPRMVRFVRRRIGRGFDRVPFETVHAHYADRVEEPPEDFATDMHPADVALQELVAPPRMEARVPLAVHIGCGVGRGCFSLAENADLVLGTDRSAAHIRRARNISVTREHFFLAAPPGSDRKELPIDLSPLARERTDFLIAEPHRLPLRTDCAALVVAEAEDGHGALTPGAVLAEARRILGPDGRLAVPRAWASEVDGEDAAQLGPYHVVRVP